MRKGLFLRILSAIAILLSGCSTPAPQPTPEPLAAPPMLLAKMQKKTDQFTRSGGLAALGIARSRSPNLATRMAQRNGRLELARILNSQMETLAKTFSEENGIPYDPAEPNGFSTAARSIIEQTIAGLAADELKQETDGETTTAYAVMVLNPRLIADELAKDSDLWTKLQSGKTLDFLNREIESYEAFRTAPQPVAL